SHSPAHTYFFTLSLHDALPIFAFHHIPCRNCFYCQRKIFAQCAVYKKVGITAGFEPAGGGFAQYVRVMDWIVENLHRQVQTQRRSEEHTSELQSLTKIVCRLLL